MNLRTWSTCFPHKNMAGHGIASPHIQRKSTTALLLSSIIIAALLYQPCEAQLTSTGTISGTVTDTTGAVVPNATVSVENQSTQTVIKSVSSSTGVIVIPGLQPGTYNVTVQKLGFQTYMITGVEVHPTIVANISATLEIGKSVSEVTVSASTAQVETSTPEISAELATSQVATLPMNGRNYQTLAALMPGTVNTAPDTQMGQGGFTTNNVMSVNGMGTTGTFYTVDGIWNENTGNFSQTSVTPPPETIQEVRLLQNNYSTQYNFMGANVVVVQTKSGTNAFHGGAYEFFRNNALNARNYFSKVVPTLRQNIYGFTLGGPVMIPHVYNTKRDKTFFFWSEQWSRVNSGSVIIGATATSAERGGDFSAVVTPIIDPSTNQPFPNNKIPQNRLVPQAVALMNASAPLPNNLSGGFDNYLNTDSLINNQRNDLIKITHDFTQNYRLMWEYIGEHAISLYPNNTFLGPFNVIKTHVTWPDYLMQVQFTAMITHAMLNVASVAMNHRIVSLTQQGISLLSQVPSYSQAVPFTGGVGADRLPMITFDGGWGSFGSSTFLPLINNSNLDLTISDDWSWLIGKHYLQAGMNDYYGLKRQTTSAASNGFWLFSGQFTGNPIADYLLGYAATLQQTSSELRPYLYYPVFSPYVQDTWKETPRLTWSAGLRYFWEPAPHVPQGTMSIFVPSAFIAANAPIVNANGTISPTNSYNPINGLVVNGINGVPLNFANVHNSYLAPSIGFALDVRGDGRTSLRGGYGVAITRIATAYNCGQTCSSNPPFQNSITLVTPQFPNSIGAAQKPKAAPALASEVPDLQPGQIQTFSLSLQHQFGGSWLASVAGAGNIGRHLGMNLDFNQPLPDGIYDFNPAINTGKTFTYLYGPYQGYAAITTSTSEGVFSWTGLELSLAHPISHGLALTAAYTWQHALTNTGGPPSNQGGTSLIAGGSSQDSHNLRNNYGNATTNIPQVFSSSIIWSLPWLKTATGVRGAILRGWQFSDITAIQTGASLIPALSVATEGLATRPDYTGKSIHGTKTAAQWFNGSAFAQPKAGYFGNAAPGSILGPGVIDFDMALYKTFALPGEETLQFRAEMFNIANHTNFATVSTTFGAGNYGQVLSARDPRVGEFALRYNF